LNIVIVPLLSLALGMSTTLIKYLRFAALFQCLARKRNIPVSFPLLMSDNLKTLIIFVSLLSAVLLRAADPANVATDNTAPSADPYGVPPATILGVSRAIDKCSLTVQYELSGRTNQLQVVLTNGIAEFHFCSWVMGRGLALAISDPQGEVYWAAFYFAGRTGPIYPRRLVTPPGYSLLGVVNNRGDSIIISAVARQSERGRASGWMYFNGCPPASGVFSQIPTNKIQVSGFQHLVMFETTPKNAK
jgi:hypothetical protein